MPTKKLYYEDPHLQTFSARVLTCRETEKGFLVTLDATAFYPEGGGQACDLGTLGTARVLDVQERDEEVVHLCDKALAVGETVEGVIDWGRRFDLMQQHSGEHIVSGLVHSLLGHHNVGFHVGSDRMEIDFDGPVSPEDLALIETRANEALWMNLPIRCWYPSPEELPGTFYRTKKALPWPVRIVEVPGFDSCACCGVHVKNTGEIGLIKILSCVKFHQGVRIELCCGNRALRLLQNVFEQNRQVSQAFSAKILETGAAAQKINETLAAVKYRSTAFRNRLFAAIAEGYADQNQVIHFEDSLDGAELRELATAIAGRCGRSVAAFSGNDSDGYSYCLSGQDDLRRLNKEMTEALNGRGGGKPNFQQGSLKATRQQIRDFFKTRP